jgi:hypothetical protein
MISAAVAFAAPQRRRWVAILAVVLFAVGGWARTNLMSPDGGRITLAWWLVTLVMGLAMFAAARDVACGLLMLSGALFGATHLPPTGPLGAACFLAAAIYQDFIVRRTLRKMPLPSGAAISTQGSAQLNSAGLP